MLKSQLKEHQTTSLLTNQGPKRNSDLREAMMILEAYQENRRGTVTLENLLKAKLGLRAPRNRMYEVLRLNGKATSQASKEQRRT